MGVCGAFGSAECAYISEQTNLLKIHSRTPPPPPTTQDSVIIVIDCDEWEFAFIIPIQSSGTLT